jgi:hypothetical protein
MEEEYKDGLVAELLSMPDLVFFMLEMDAPQE